MQQKTIVQNSQIRPTIVNPNQQQQFIAQQQSQQQQQPSGAAASATDEELYNRKIEDLQQHLPRLERLLANATGNTFVIFFSNQT